MFQIGNIKVENAVLLAPMEDVTDLSFRLICRKLGADVVYTEFVNSEGLVRSSEKTHLKLRISDDERPVGIQIYGGNIQSMIDGAKIAESENPELIDINAGCWVKDVVNFGAGSALLKDLPFLQKLVKQVVNAVSTPVTVKTRLGWDEKNIQILEAAKRIEDAGAEAITIHCRTRNMGNRGDADWSWISKVKKEVHIPVVLNGNILTAFDVKKAFDETGADGVMIARGAIGNPWIFKEAKELLNKGLIEYQISAQERIKTCLDHLALAAKIKGERRAVIEHRKFYTGYLKGLFNASKIRTELMSKYEFSSIEDILYRYIDELAAYQQINYQALGT